MEKTVNRGEYFSAFIELKNTVKLNDKLMSKLREHDYFKDEMQKVVMHLPTDSEKLLFILVEFTRSRSTCDELIRLLRESGQRVAADQLVEYNTSKGHNVKVFDPSNAEFVRPQIPFQLSKSPIKGSSVYTMDQKPRGKCVIINNMSEELPIESKRFRYIFETLHFQVDEWYDLSAKQMTDKLKTMAPEVTAGQPSQAFVAMIISHGKEERVLGSQACEALRALKAKAKQLGNTKHHDAKIPRLTDTDVVDIKDIVDIFSDTNCPKLSKCPKLFFFTCCRNSPKTGQKGQNVVESETLDQPFVAEAVAYKDRTNFPQMRSLDKQWIDNNKDTYICYSCAEGHKTFYRINSGMTYFGQALSHSIAQYACEESLSSIMSRTCDLLQFFTKNSGVNLPEFRGKGLRRQLYFNPMK